MFAMCHTALIRLLVFILLAGWNGASALFAADSSVTNKPSGVTLDFEPNLPVVFLDVKGSINSDKKTDCTLKVAYPKGAARGSADLLPGEIKYHGATSQGYPKKSFSLTLDHPAPLTDLRKSAHWILNAAYVDRSLMRHKLSYDLFKSLSSKGAPRYAVASRFVDVYLNGKYNGVYLLMERFDKQLLGFRSYKTNDPNQACIYKAVDHGANFGNASNSGYEQRDPDPVLKTFWEPLTEFNRFTSRTPPDRFFNPTNGIESRLDLDNAIDFHLLVLLTSNSDGITKNFFFSRNGQGPGPQKQKFFFSPWDYDGTFGRNWDGNRYPHDVWLSNHLFDRLLANAGYREKFAARWKQLRERQFSAKTIEGMMDQNARTLGEAVKRNAARWPIASGGYPDNASFEEDIAQMKTWVAARIQWLDQEIARTAEARQ